MTAFKNRRPCAPRGQFRLMRMALSAAMLFGAAGAWGQTNERPPHIGYLFPAGGQAGATFQISVGGQYLRGVTDVLVSGEGVSGTIVKYYRPMINLDRDQRQELQRLLREVTDKRLNEMAATGDIGPMGLELIKNIRNANTPGGPQRANSPNARQPQNKSIATSPDQKAQTGAAAEPVKLPEHPMLEDLDNKSLRELQAIRDEFFNAKRKQPNAQLGETVTLEISIGANAAPGDREIRLLTPQGLTNPLCFQVGALKESIEQEPNNQRDYPLLPAPPPIELPVEMNGQIKPGDIDRFKFSARQGQRLVFEMKARHLIPYLADAVPGWFQATLALYDSKGEELAFTDDYRFDPDPVLLFEVPETGVYELEVRDAIYRGREDFVYRLSIGELPFITGMYPLGGKAGQPASAWIAGWNLGADHLALDTRPGAEGIREAALRQGALPSNFIAYDVDTRPECEEQEPNDSEQAAQRIAMPQIVNGFIAKAGDRDIFRIEGRAGDQIVAEVCGRRLNSPLDSLLRAVDSDGTVLEWNDDYEEKQGFLRTEAGLVTHFADSYLTAKLPADGVCFIELTDAQNHGSPVYGYRLRLTPPQPDFELRVTPSSLNVRNGGATPLTVYVLRKDGFDGAIQLALKDAPAGFALQGARIPAGCDHIRLTLAAPATRLNQPAVLQIEGRASIGGQTVSRQAFPAEDLMQAFLYRHLTPSRELLVATQNSRIRMPAIELADAGPVRIPAGGEARTKINTPNFARLREIQCELSDPPEGVSLRDVAVVPGGLELNLKAADGTARTAYADNLIVKIFMEAAPPAQGARNANQPARVPLGVLPAIPFEIVER